MAKHLVKRLVRKQTWKTKRESVAKVLTPRCRQENKPECGRFTPRDIEQIIQQTDSNAKELMPYLEDLENLGNYVMAYATLLDLALYRALKEKVDPDYAMHLVGDVNWQFVMDSGGYYRLKRKLIALTTKDPLELMGKFLADMLKFPYSAPGYRAELYRVGDVYHMDYYTCPPYDFYKQFGEEEVTLFRTVFCTYDYAAVERLVEGGKYERVQTLSYGDPVCAQRWSIPNPPPH